MRRLRPPFHLRPLEHHAVLALLVLAAAAFGGRWLVEHSHGWVVRAERQLGEAREALRREGDAATIRGLPQGDFTQRFPAAAHLDEVLHQATRYAEAHGLQLTSMAVERRAASSGELGHWRVAFAFQGSYAALKSWLADMQVRNEALAIASLQLRRGTGTLLEAELVLALFTRD